MVLPIHPDRWQVLAICGLCVLWQACVCADTRVQQIEQDWILQERQRTPTGTRDDALSAVDGIKDGSWAFHTGSDNPPWWQVDIGREHKLSKVAIYNRCDGAASRTSRLILLLSSDGKSWQKAYQHNGETFYGATDGKPLVVSLDGRVARFVRIQQPQAGFLHLDEVEVYTASQPNVNIALWKDADQSSISQWSSKTVRPGREAEHEYKLEEVLDRGHKLAADLTAMGVDTATAERELEQVRQLVASPAAHSERAKLWRRARWAARALSFDNPLLAFDNLLFVKRVPGSFSHMSDQYYGWWSRPGGGIYILEGFKTDAPRERCLTPDMPQGSFLRPDISHDGHKVLFAYCRHYADVSAIRDKQTKTNLPEDAFYHIFEMNIDGTGLRRLTHGRYDDFDARYLPNGEIVFLSTRRGQFIRTGPAAAQATLNAVLPDSYVRCGGDAYRPVAIYTLHVMDADGGNLRGISPFENFEWTPSVTHDGRIIYARWDYVDRDNMPYMSLWSVNPDGTNPRAVYGNFTHAPHCCFEARSVPESGKIMFTASAHHSLNGGSLVMLDPAAQFDGAQAITRLTPEVGFPEIETWPLTYYANPWPLSERYYLAVWSHLPLQGQGTVNPPNGPGLYLCDAFGNLELIHRDPDIGCMYPIPVRPRPRPAQIPSAVDWRRRVGRFVLLDVYRGLPGVKRGDVHKLRIVGVPPKTQPVMNSPNLGLTRDDPGKYVLGTVPVTADGSAYFSVPAGASVFFQALDDKGMAIQTMRTLTCVQPGQTLSCVGCHEPRNTAPRNRRSMATSREPSRITTGPEGSWPLRFDRLVQPVLDRSCIRCHRPDSNLAAAAKLDLRHPKAYDNLVSWGKPSLADHVRRRYREGRSQVGGCVARRSPLLAMLTGPNGHHGVRLDADQLSRLCTWMDTYAQRLGSFSPDQEQRLVRLREQSHDILQE